MNDNKPDISKWPIEALRIYTGIFFGLAGWGKVTREPSFDIAGWLGKVKEDSFDFYQPLIDSIFIPNAGIFSFLVAWGEVAMGIALVLGIATRYASFAGAFMVANFWFAHGYGFFGSDPIWMMILLVLALVPAGRVFGLDQVLSKRFAFLR